MRKIWRWEDGKSNLTLTSHLSPSPSPPPSTLTLNPQRSPSPSTLSPQPSTLTSWEDGKYLGEIAEIAHTYRVVGNMNEHQLSIGETTFTGRCAAATQPTDPSPDPDPADGP